MAKLLFVDVDGTLTETISGATFKQHPKDVKIIEGADKAIALWSALNGANTSHTETLPALQQSTASELLEDGMTELALKVGSWTPIQWIAAVDACDRVGNGQHRIDDLPAELTRAGLIAP